MSTLTYFFALTYRDLHAHISLRRFGLSRLRCEMCVNTFRPECTFSRPTTVASRQPFSCASILASILLQSTLTFRSKKTSTKRSTTHICLFNFFIAKDCSLSYSAFHVQLSQRKTVNTISNMQTDLPDRQITPSASAQQPTHVARNVVDDECLRK